MTDYPAGAFVTGTGVRNVALEFNTCIYKASDVPGRTRRDDIHFAKALNCFQWQNVYVYDFDKSRFGTDLADVPGWDEPSAPINRYLIVIVVTLLIALFLVIVLRLTKMRSQKLSANG
jgi:hypothetical protein